MKFFYCLSFVPVLAAFVTTTVLALPAPINNRESGIEAREYKFQNLEARFPKALSAEDEKLYRQVFYRRALGFSSLVAKLRKPPTEEQKQAKIQKLQKKFAKKSQKHYTALSQAQHGYSGLTVHSFHGKEEHRKIAEAEAHKSYRMFGDLHKFGKADVHVKEEPGKLHITAQYHNGPGTSKSSPVHMFHHTK